MIYALIILVFIAHRLALIAVRTSEESDSLKVALRKIANPNKYHHVEPADYTQKCCFMHIANEALEAVGEET